MCSIPPKPPSPSRSHLFTVSFASLHRPPLSPYCLSRAEWHVTAQAELFNRRKEENESIAANRGLIPWHTSPKLWVFPQNWSFGGRPRSSNVSVEYSHDEYSYDEYDDNLEA